MWNRIGGLLTALCRRAEIEPAAALAVWMVECGGLPFRRGKPVLRFEPHVFFSEWGQAHAAEFDNHFQFGGRNDVEGARWQRHRFRPRLQGDWRSFHGDQHAEYEALKLAVKLAGREVALRSASLGGPQIMGFNHRVAGYDNARGMFEHVSRSERWQICAFFDFCAAKDILAALRQHDWHGFATTYNGPGNAEAYAGKIADAWAAARRTIVAGKPAASCGFQIRT